MKLHDRFRAGLIAHMENRGMSKAELARQAGFSRTYAGQLLNDTHMPTIATLDKIAGVFGVPAWTLIAPEGIVDSVNQPEAARLVNIFADLSPAERVMLLRMANGMVRQTDTPD